MENASENWLEKAISEGYINNLKYNKFINPIFIGSGAFGNVFKYEWKDCDLTVALKCLKIDNNIGLNEKFIKDFIKEYADDGNLREYLKANFAKLQWTDKLCIAKEIALGLFFLHDNDIIHRDLHSKNILIHQKHPKIADFGLSKQISEMSTNSIVRGMPAYVEPQCLFKQGYKRDERSDVYSIGAILWEISSGKPPFLHLTNEMIVVNIFQGNREDPIEGTPPQYIELYKRCWNSDPVNRPETKEILDTLKQFNPNGILGQRHTIGASTQNNDTSSSHQDNPTALVNSLVITTSSPLYLPDTINSNVSMQVCSIDDMRKEAHECFEQGKFLKALELYEEILKNDKHSDEDRKNASSWKLTNKSLGSEKINELIKALCKNTTLISLKLYYNNLGSEFGKALTDALCRNTTLISLNLYSNNLGSEGGKALADTLYKNNTLTTLDLDYNGLKLEGGKALADALCKSTTLTSLNLRRNDLGSEGGKALAYALCENNTLTTLNLEWNNIGSEGGKALADALCKNATLTSLELRKNNLGSKGGNALADALCKNITITYLDLSGNNLGSEGGKALADALCKNNTLIYLNLRENNLGSKGGNALADALCKNNTLEKLNICDNNIDFTIKSNNSNINIYQ